MWPERLTSPLHVSTILFHPRTKSYSGRNPNSCWIRSPLTATDSPSFSMEADHLRRRPEATKATSAANAASLATPKGTAARGGHRPRTPDITEMISLRLWTDPSLTLYIRPAAIGAREARIAASTASASYTMVRRALLLSTDRNRPFARALARVT